MADHPVPREVLEQMGAYLDESDSLAAIPGFADFCTRAAERATMTDEQFWADVYDRYSTFGEPEDDVEVLSIGGTPCPVCGCSGECGVDTEGRPMIHAIPADLDE